MAKLIRLTAEQRTDLVAYLDGELPEEASREIEKVLAQSPVARNEVESLARTYELLDTLERGKASEEFSKKTMTMVRLEGSAVPVQQQAWYQLGRRGLLVAAAGVGLIGAGAAGYAITQRLVPQEHDLLVNDLPVIQNLDVYREVESLDGEDGLEFLRRLQNSPEMSEIREEILGGRDEK